MAKLASALPKGDGNGLAAIERGLIDDPDTIRVAVILLDCKSVKTDMDSGEVEATARIRRLEVVLPKDAAICYTMLRRALESRTGKTVLPFELEEELRAAFGEIHESGDDDGRDKGDT